MHAYDTSTRRLLIDGRGTIEGLTDAELEAELTIAAVAAHDRAGRLEALLQERMQRGVQAVPEAA